MVSDMTKTLDHKTNLEYVSPDLLDFDPTNPRFAGFIASKKQDTIQQELFGEPFYASELVDSFVENGFIDYEPLVVSRNGSRFNVVEGNRRLAAIKEIRAHPDKYTGRVSDLEKIPVLVFPERPDEQQQNEMRVYLGVRHMFGFREWPPVSKAHWLERESKKAGGIDKVTKETRITKTQARRFLVPFRLLGKADEKIPKGEDFWTLGEALTRAGIKEFVRLEVDPETLEVLSFDKRNFSLLLNDLYGPKKSTGERDTRTKVVTDTRSLSRLANVLSSEKANSVLHAGKTLDEAEIYVDTREQSISRLYKLSKGMGVLLRKLRASHDLILSYRRFDAAVKKFVSKE
jgi:hypothetical protein